MAGKRIIVIERRTYTFTNLQTSGTQTTILDRALDVGGYKEGTVQVIVHAQTFAAGQTLTVTGTPIQLVDSEPQTDYLASSGAAATATFTTSTSGKMIIGQLGTGFGSHIQLAINATQSTTGTGFACTITVIVVLKD